MSIWQINHGSRKFDDTGELNYQYLMGYFYAFFLFAIALQIGFRFLMNSYDKKRIKEEVELKRGEVVSIKWTPFGIGWLFEKNERLYLVTYVDRLTKKTRYAECKTSMFTGVYWAD